MICRTVCQSVVFLLALISEYSAVPEAYAQLPRLRIGHPLALPGPCTSTQPVVNYCPGIEPCGGPFLVTKSRCSCGDCSYYYDTLEQEWRYSANNCISGCKCVLPAVARIGNNTKITACCSEAALNETEFFLSLEDGGVGPINTFRFRLPDQDQDTFKYRLELNGKVWKVVVDYKQPGPFLCTATPIGFAHDLKSTLTTKAHGPFNHNHNANMGNCVVYPFGDFNVKVTLEP